MKTFYTTVTLLYRVSEKSIYRHYRQVRGKDKFIYKLLYCLQDLKYWFKNILQNFCSLLLPIPAGGLL
jgi:hypothetical protein